MKVCNNCRARNNINAKFCKNCGESFEKTVKKEKSKLKWLVVLIVLFALGIVAAIYLLIDKKSSETPGILIVNSDPSGARCYLNDEYRGITPFEEKDLKPGKYSLKVEKKGYKQHYEEAVRIKPGEKIVLTVTLETEAQKNKTSPPIVKKTETKRDTTTGALLVESTPSGASIYLDGQYKGTTPYNIDNLSSGIYEIKIKKEDYDEYERQVQVNPGKLVEVSITLNKKVLSWQDAPADTPVGLVRSYYEALDNQDADAAIAKWKNPNAKRILRKSIKNIEWFRVNNLQLENESSGYARVWADVTGKGKNSKPEQWVGTIQVEEINGQWKIVTLSGLKKLKSQ